MEKECEVMPSHIGKINCIKRSYDHKILVTCGEDSTIFIYRVSDAPNSRIGLTTRKTASRFDNLESEAKRIKYNKEQVDSIANKSKESIDQEEVVAVPQVKAKKDEQDSESDESDMDNNEIVRIRKLH